jgi:acetolactate synthase-1/2/3 large subunit
MIRVADYLARGMVHHGIRDVFLVTGGGAMHLNDAIGRCRDLSYLCCHHEQACAMAAASYYRLTNRLAAVNVTTGPGGTNAITGVFGAWVESLGMVVLSGQVKFETVVRSTGLPLRQLGDQEIDITRIVAPITKYAVMVTDPSSVRYHLEKAIHLARSGRPGPVWLDIPMNVQGAQVSEEDLPGFDPDAEDLTPRTNPRKLAELARVIRERCRSSSRPVILAGSGIRLSGAEALFLELVDRWRVPVVTGFNAHDVLWQDHPLNIGRQGTIGDRAGNFATQNSDFLLVLGSRLTIRQVSYNWENFARAAFMVVVDIDEAELRKPTVRADLPVRSDAGDLIRHLLELPVDGVPESHNRWRGWCAERKRRYPVVLPEYWTKPGLVNPYCFVEELFRQLPEDEIVVTGDGTACVATFQAAKLKRGQRLYSDGGCAPMGFDLPAAVGAAVGGRRRVICLAGDGSIQMNVQELQTIATNRLPVTIFALSNEGYLSIRLTQQTYFPDNPVGCDPASGVGIPDFRKLADAYGLPYRVLRSNDGLAEGISAVLADTGPQLCEVVLDPTQPFAPKTSSRKLPDGRMISAPLEDMYPFLDRDEFRANMLIPPVEE